MRSSTSLLVPLVPFLALAACKDADTSGVLGGAVPGGAVVEPIDPSLAGTRGCNGGAQAFAGCSEIDLTGVLAALAPPVSSLTRIAAATSGPDLLYATAIHSASGDSTVLELDLANPGAPVVRDLLPPGAVDAHVTSALGANTQGELGELAVLDASTLIVCELASNVLLAVGRSTPASLLPFAGRASGADGFLDGTAPNARFLLDAESQLCPTADGRVFVADTGNNAVRAVFGNPLFDPTSFVLTMVGDGPASAGSADGTLAVATLDAPTGLVVTCTNELVVTERGDGGAGHRVRRITFFGFDPFAGAFLGQTGTAAGDGTAASLAGAGTGASVAAPAGPQASMAGELYWIDAGTGAIRRQDVASGQVDCPLAPFGDCTQPSQVCSPGQADFTPGASFSTALSGDGDLYVLESGTTLLRRFGP